MVACSSLCTSATEAAQTSLQRPRSLFNETLWGPATLLHNLTDNVRGAVPIMFSAKVQFPPLAPPPSAGCIPHLFLPTQTYNNRTEIWLLIGPPKAKHSECWDCLQWGGVMKVCSFRCLFLFWLDCVRLGVSPRACCSHYGCGNLLLMAAICCMHQGYQEQRLAVHGNQTKE